MSVTEQSARFAIPPEHTIETHNGCEYFNFQLNGATLLECRHCGMRSLYNPGFNEIYHNRRCQHWQVRLVIQSSHSSHFVIPPPPPYTQYDLPPPYTQYDLPPPYRP